MNVLTIGNSFSDDATRYLSQIARSQGVHFDVVNICIGGCSLERHYRNMIGNIKDYWLWYNGGFTGFYTTLEEALVSREWDVITLQQVSHLSFKKETYYPYITALVEFIKECQAKAKLYLQETWPYEKDSDRLNNMAGYATPEDMLADIKKAYNEVAEAEGFDGIIPSGDMMQALLENGIAKVHRDTFHASLGVGRYALGLLWFRALTGKSVMENSFSDFDVPATAEEIEIAKRTVESFEPINK
jgi:hypothetical protein